mmetsp:Transcript_94241/g.209379  ORF Transcript_94241/g.209379 Transcript_94241/m.209379 type:complete len:233 (-) Transcript_94241:282-980(-)
MLRLHRHGHVADLLAHEGEHWHLCLLLLLQAQPVKLLLRMPLRLPQFVDLGLVSSLDAQRGPRVQHFHAQRLQALLVHQRTCDTCPLPLLLARGFLQLQLAGLSVELLRRPSLVVPQHVRRSRPDKQNQESDSLPPSPEQALDDPRRRGTLLPRLHTHRGHLAVKTSEERRLARSMLSHGHDEEAQGAKSPALQSTMHEQWLLDPGVPHEQLEGSLLLVQARLLLCRLDGPL